MNADSNGIARPRLWPFLRFLHKDHYCDAHLATMLRDEVTGSSMPPWRQLDKADLAAVNAVHSLKAPATPMSMSSQDLDKAARLHAQIVYAATATTEGGNGPAAGALKPSPVNFHRLKATCRPVGIGPIHRGQWKVSKW
jgi:hypothetical protein